MLYSICVLVTIPDEAVASNTIHRDIPSEVVEGARSMLDRMEALRKAPMPTDEVLPEQSDVPFKRIEAIGLRDEIKEMR